MAKVAKKKQKDPSATGSISRKKRTSFERKCLSKPMKRLFMGSSKEIFRLIYAVELELKKKPKSDNKDKK
jgi:hypothetical protein